MDERPEASSGRELLGEGSSTTLHQDSRGKTVISEKDGRKVFEVLLSETADVSTLAHEFAHIWLVQFEQLATSDAATRRARTDYAAILTYLGAQPGEKLTVEQQEKWAQGFEAFLMEGKAPAESLERAFDRFKGWLKGVYSKSRRLDVELNDNIRPVFQRLFATDRQVKAYADMAVGQPMAPSFDGVPVSEWVDYLKRRAEAVRDVTRKGQIYAYSRRLTQLDNEAVRQAP